MTLRDFQDLNNSRAYSEEAKTKWGDCRTRTLQDWAIYTGGEAGELLNAVKKLCMDPQPQHAIAGLERDVVDEAVDVITYAFLLIDFIGLDVQVELLRKFDEVSERIGWSRA